MRSARRRGIRAATLFLSLLCFAAPAFAADDEEQKEFFDVPVKERGKPYIQWVVGVLFIAAGTVMAFKNPARSHLD